MNDRRKVNRTSSGRRKSDSLVRPEPVLERWQIISRALDDVEADGVISAKTWALMSARDRALFPGKAPVENGDILVCVTS